MLLSTAIPKPTVATPTPSPLGTLLLVGPVDFMEVDPVLTSLSPMLKCSTRQQISIFTPNFNNVVVEK